MGEALPIELRGHLLRPDSNRGLSPVVGSLRVITQILLLKRERF